MEEKTLSLVFPENATSSTLGEALKKVCFRFLYVSLSLGISDSSVTCRQGRQCLPYHNLEMFKKIMDRK